MIEVRNRLYTQRFYSKELSVTDIFRAVHYITYRGDKSKIPFWYSKEVNRTGIQNLRMDDDQFLRSFKPNTRNEIRRAEKEGCLFETNIPFEKFVTYYNKFATEKGLVNIDVGTLAKYNRIVTTSSIIMNDFGTMQILAMHATLFSEEDKSATLMYSCSPRLEDGIDSKLIGWGNRYLHYRDFILFRNMGAERYEWNGICVNSREHECYGIRKFKLGFHSEEVENIGLRTPLLMLMHFAKYRMLDKVLKRKVL